MKNNYYFSYDFNTEVSYLSKIDASGIKTFKYEAVGTPHICQNFYCQEHDMNIPLNVPTLLKNNLFEGNVVLTCDYISDKPVVITNNAKINLNGNKVVAPVFAESNGEITEGSSDSYAFWVKEGELVIEGDGEVVAQEATYSIAVWANGGNVVIKGGKFYNNGNNSDLIYASNGSNVEIYGGEFYANENKGASGTKNQYPALNIKDKDRENTTIKVFGGKFYGFNPANNVSEGTNTNFVAEGYKSVEIETNVWEVIKE